MLTMRDIADRLIQAGHLQPDTAYGTVRQWRSRGKLPEPAGIVGQSPWWTEAAITDWMRYLGVKR